jgi:ssDNA-binding Zn-finger/Zn-ribbon topoisomerase 1
MKLTPPVANAVQRARYATLKRMNKHWWLCSDIPGQYYCHDCTATGRWSQLYREVVVMTEPREDDDVALDKDSECEDCGNFMFECVCNTPDEPYDVVYAE